MLGPGDKGGVEEKKEDFTDMVSPKSLRNRTQTSEVAEDDAEDTSGSQWYAFARALLGSCSNVIEAAGWCRWPSDNVPAHQQPPEPAAPPLSVADELRRLAAMEGRPFQPAMRSTDIPKFLGEDAVYSFEDDNISALSQHTLEEMAHLGKVHRTYRRRESDRSGSPPSPTQTTSYSSSSSKDRKLTPIPPESDRDLMFEA